MSRLPICCVDGCESVALRQAVVLIWKIDQKPAAFEPVRVLLDFKACAICKHKQDLNDLVDDDCFEKISVMFKTAGVSPPDRSTMKLEWGAVRGGKS